MGRYGIAAGGVDENDLLRQAYGDEGFITLENQSG
jgi:hypothetical protein